MRLCEEQIIFNVFKAIKYSTEIDICFKTNVIDRAVHNHQIHVRLVWCILNPLKLIIVRLRYVQDFWKQVLHIGVDHIQEVGHGSYKAIAIYSTAS